MIELYYKLYRYAKDDGGRSGDSDRGNTGSNRGDTGGRVEKSVESEYLSGGSNYGGLGHSGDGGGGGGGGKSGPSAAEIKAAREKEEREKAITKANEVANKVTSMANSTSSREQQIQEAAAKDALINSYYEDAYKKAMDEAAALGKGTAWAQEQAKTKTDSYVNSGKADKDLATKKEIAEKEAKTALDNLEKSLNMKEDDPNYANRGLAANAALDTLVSSGVLTEDDAKAYADKNFGGRVNGVKASTDIALDIIRSAALGGALSGVSGTALYTGLRDAGIVEKAMETMNNVKKGTTAAKTLGYVNIISSLSPDTGWNSALYGDRPSPYSNTASELEAKFAAEDAAKPSVTTTTPDPTPTPTPTPKPSVTTTTPTPTPTPKPTISPTKTPEINLNKDSVDNTKITDAVELPKDESTAFSGNLNIKAEIKKDDISDARDKLNESKETYLSVEKELKQARDDVKNKGGNTDTYDKLLDKASWDHTKFNRTSDIQYDNSGYDVNKQNDKEINFGEDPTKPNFTGDNWNYGMDIVSTDIVSDEELKSFINHKDPDFERLVTKSIIRRLSK